LPNWRPHREFFPCPKGKPALDELDGSLNSGNAIDGEQQVEMVRHDYEIVQSKFVLSAIVVKNAQEQSGSPIGLQEVLLSPGRGCDEKRANFAFTWAGFAWRAGMDIRQRLKPVSFSRSFGTPEGVP
jgi:hypothetical protein